MGDGVGDTPQTVMTTRAPAVLIKSTQAFLAHFNTDNPNQTFAETG